MQSRSKYRCGRSEDAGLADAAAEVVLDGLSPSIKRATILDVLSHYGVIRDIVLLPSGPVNRAVITFGSKRQAARALADLTGSAAEGFLCQSDVISTGAYSFIAEVYFSAYCVCYSIDVILLKYKQCLLL